MMSLVGCGSVFQHKPNFKTYSNFTAKKNYPTTCSSLQSVVVNNVNYSSHNIEEYSSKCSSLLRGANNADMGKSKIVEEFSKAGLQREKMPKHVAIILDGSRRWLKSQGKALSYEPFFEANTLFADLCLKWGVGTATTFIYSLKNLQRGQEANDLIFEQLERYLENNLEEFIR